MIVVDTNVVAYLLIPQSQTRRAERLFLREPQWAVPVLWRSEFRSVLAAYLGRGLMSLAQAHDIQRAAEELLRGTEFAIDSLRVLTLVADSDCSAYECEYVALAMALGVELVTNDTGIRRAFPRVARAL